MSAITVVMPIYRTKKVHLKMAIESVLRQSLADFLFIILNDSPEEKELYAEIKEYDDKRIQYLENDKTEGVAKSYNRLLKEAKTEYVAMMNHDDIALLQRLEKQLLFLEANEDIGVLGTAYKKFGEINRFKTVVNPVDDAKLRAMMLFKSPLHHPTIMFRRDVAVKNNIWYNENFVSLNDRQFYYDMSKYTKLANLEEPLYKYRFHEDMVSKREKKRISKEQHVFHEMWLRDMGVHLSLAEKMAFEEYATVGRCRIRTPETLEMVRRVLEKLVAENARLEFVPQKEFADICAKYLLKRCLNAAVYGKISSADILQQTGLPMQSNMWLNIFNYALQWREQ